MTKKYIKTVREKEMHAKSNKVRYNQNVTRRKREREIVESEEFHPQTDNL